MANEYSVAIHDYISDKIAENFNPKLPRRIRESLAPKKSL